jgi:hypothetical protein
MNQKRAAFLFTRSAVAADKGLTFVALSCEVWKQRVSVPYRENKLGSETCIDPDESVVDEIDGIAELPSDGGDSEKGIGERRGLYGSLDVLERFTDAHHLNRVGQLSYRGANRMSLNTFARGAEGALEVVEPSNCIFRISLSERVKGKEARKILHSTVDLRRERSNKCCTSIPKQFTLSRPTGQGEKGEKERVRVQGGRIRKYPRKLACGRRDLERVVVVGVLNDLVC